MSERIRLAVWGDPIAHSQSPALHSAAYAALGLDWQYDRRQVDEAGFDAAIDGLDDAWRGLSLTMPLKERAFDRADELVGISHLPPAVREFCVARREHPELSLAALGETFDPPASKSAMYHRLLRLEQIVDEESAPEKN